MTIMTTVYQLIKDPFRLLLCKSHFSHLRGSRSSVGDNKQGFTLVMSPFRLRNALHCSPFSHFVTALRIACHPSASLHATILGVNPTKWGSIFGGCFSRRGFRKSSHHRLSAYGSKPPTTR